MRRIVLLFLALGVGGCLWAPEYDSLGCEAEGATEDGRRCEGGVWVVHGSDGGADAGPDTAGADGGVDAGPDLPCSAESDSVFCERLALNCGAVTALDNCDDARSVVCGACNVTTQQCVANVCQLIPETDEELCTAAGATCDTIMVEDRTGAMRSVDCGSCTAPLECGIGGTPNTCACLTADDVQFCIDNVATCGPVTALDPACGVTRTVNCGMCVLPETCGGAGVANSCGCAESDTDFCARLGRDCGPVTAPDACGVTRSVDCGTCTLPESCGGGGVMGVCGCTVAAACLANAAQCGTVDVAAMCANLATADCGGCGTNGTCQPTNLCLCDAGYSYDGAACADDDECLLGTDNCSVNASCTNNGGSFTCSCNAGFTGDGVTCVATTPPSIVESNTDDSVNATLTAAMTGVSNDLYVVFVSIRTTSRQVQGITGLGLTWGRAAEHCDGVDQQVLEVWTARGTTTGSGDVTVSLTGAPYASVMTIYRLTNVPTAGLAGWSQIRNSNGVAGSCVNSNPTASYTFDYPPQSTNSLILTAAAIEEYTHTEGAGFTELHELHRAAGSDRDAGIATMSATNAASAPITVSGTMSSSTNWAAAVYEVRGN